MTDSDISSRPVIEDRPNENLSWQRTELGTGGRYTGRDYYDTRLTEPDAGAPKPVPPAAEVTGRSLRIIGTLVALAGFAGWLWLILTFVSSIGSRTLPDDPFGVRLAGISLGSGGLVAILLGGALSAIGSWLVRIARARRSRVRWGP